MITFLAIVGACTIVVLVIATIAFFILKLLAEAMSDAS